QPQQHAVVVDGEADEIASPRVGGRPGLVDRADDRAVRDSGQVVRVGRRLAVLGRDDDCGAAGQVVGVDPGDHHADFGVDVFECAHQQRAGDRPARRVPARQPVGGGQLLGRGDGLEVHPEDRRGAHVLLTAVVETVDPVQHRLDLVAVVLNGRGVVRGPVIARRVADGVAVDLRGEVVLDPRSGRPGQYLVRGVLVGPGGAQPVVPGYVEDRVDLKVLVWVDRL